MERQFKGMEDNLPIAEEQEMFSFVSRVAAGNQGAGAYLLSLYIPLS